jgi:predicted acylesterase/phospholipase RssA
MSYKNLVLSGGGVRGLYYIGFMKYYSDNLKNFKNIAGTSIGAFVAVAIALGYSSDELLPYLVSIVDYSKVKSIQIFDFINNLGLDDGAKLEHFIKRMIRNKIGRKDITFSQTYKEYGKNIILTAVCVETKELVYLSKETFPNMKIWKAVRMSLGVPFLFKPFLYNGKNYIDGGLKHNFPIDLFTSSDTLGIDLSGQSRNCPKLNLEEYIFSIVDVVTRIKTPIINQTVIKLNNSANPDKPLVPFLPDLDDSFILEAIDYSYEIIKDFFTKRDEQIKEICKDIVIEIIDTITQII